MKHSFISGYGSFLFWMRPDSVGPYLLMTPDDNTKLEFWDVLNGYEAYIHSYVAGTNAAAQYPGGDHAGPALAPAQHQPRRSRRARSQTLRVQVPMGG